jgi:hypothetical protein
MLTRPASFEDRALLLGFGHAMTLIQPFEAALQDPCLDLGQAE